MSNDKILKRKDLIYPALCYQLIGVLFEIYNELGYGHKEIIYQKAMANLLKKMGISFKEQIYNPITFKGDNIGKNYFDFLIEDKIIVELKRGNYFHKAHIEQVYQYLVSSNLKLGLLVYFSPQKLHFKRIVNLLIIYSYIRNY